MEQQIQRQTAFKVWISSLLSGKYTKGVEQFEAGFIEVNNTKVSRVNMIGIIIDKFEAETQVSLTLDDGSGSIRVKAWNENISLMSGFNIGDLVIIVGKVKEYNNQVYVTPEIVKTLDNPLWLKVRKLELSKTFGEPARVITEVVKDSKEEDEDRMNVVEEKVTNEKTQSSREKIFHLIESMDKGEGVHLTGIIVNSGIAEDDIENLIDDMIKEGEIFEIQKNKLRIVG